MDVWDTANTDTHPGNSRNRAKRLILGLLLLGLVTVASLGVVAYFTLGQLKNGFQAIGPVIPGGQSVQNRIAFVGNDDNIWYVSPDGQDLRAVTRDGNRYRFPTWAPDGSYLAFIGRDDERNSVLYVAPTGQNTPSILYRQPDSAPFYLYWAPDSHSITFLTQEKSGLAMRQVNTQAGDSRVMATGAPFYWVWSPQGDKLLMHVGGSRAVSEEAHLSILENQANAGRIELDLAPGRFQAPAWSSDGSYFYYIAADKQGNDGIYKTNAATLEQSLVTEVKGVAFMVLSPDNRRIAFLQIEQGNRAPFGTAYIINTDGSNRRRITDAPVGSMYWSPDGSKLALMTIGRRTDGSTAKAGGLALPLPQEVIFRWLIFNPETDALEVLTTFTPTRDFLQTVPYFDQYHLSLTFWSPDSRYFIVIKGEMDSSDGTIWIFDTTGAEEARQIAEGRMAVWSWQ